MPTTTDQDPPSDKLDSGPAGIPAGSAGTGPVGPVGSAGSAGSVGTPEITDGRQLRRRRNREAVVEALLDLYRDGHLKPSTEAIAARSGLSPRSLFRYFDDVDDLVNAAIARQEERSVPLLPIHATQDQPVADKVAALVEQRFRLFGVVGTAAAVSRLRAPFQPLLAAELTRNRALLRSQIEVLFAPELNAIDRDRATRALAAADVMASFEALQLLLQDQGLPQPEAVSAMAGALVAILTPAPRISAD
jgi:AcrR family transcriptional regulator